MIRGQTSNVKIFLIIWGLFLLGIMVCLSAFTIAKIKNDVKLTNAQVNQIGKPTKVEWNQFYHSPNEVFGK